MTTTINNANSNPVATRSELLKIRRRQDKVLVHVRRDLHHFRTKVGARTAFGIRISHAIETTGNCLEASEDYRPILLQSLAAQLSGIEQHRSGIPLLNTRARIPHPGRQVNFDLPAHQ